MRSNRITLGGLAQRRADALGISGAALAEARWGSGSEVQGTEFLRKYGTLPDGRRVLLDIAYDRPEHVAKFHLLDDAERS